MSECVHVHVRGCAWWWGGGTCAQTSLTCACCACQLFDESGAEMADTDERVYGVFTRVRRGVAKRCRALERRGDTRASLREAYDAEMVAAGIAPGSADAAAVELCIRCEVRARASLPDPTHVTPLPTPGALDRTRVWRVRGLAERGALR
jgi:hypothetical protein